MIKPLDTALELRSWGFLVLPAAYQKPHPKVEWEPYQDPSVRPSDEDYEEWFGHIALCNYWVLNGRPSCAATIDSDNRRTIEWLYANCGAKVLDSTVSSLTNRGQHWWFRLQPGEIVPSWKLHDGKIEADFQSEGRGVIAPPSIHRKGTVYRWVRSPAECELQPLPAFLREAPFLEKPKANGSKPKAAAKSGLADLLANPAPKGGRNTWLISVCGHLAKESAFEDGYVEKARLAATKLRPPLDRLEIEKTIQSCWQAEKAQRHKAALISPDLYTDAGNARRFAAEHAPQVLYVDGHGFRVYQDGCYLASEPLLMQRALATVQHIWGEVKEQPDEKVRSRMLRWAQHSSSAHGVKSMLELARADAALQASIGDFDAHPLYFNTSNGVVDLSSAELLAHDPSFRLTKCAGTSYEPSASCPLWTAHMERIFDGDHAMIDFFQRLCGYAMTGYNTEQKLAILHGYGANGKSVTIETLRYILGSYAETTDFKTFSVTRSDGPRNDLARLSGSRFVTASETNSRQWLDEAVVKQVTGGEPITARFLHREFFAYTPQFTVFLSTNHRPNIEGVDRGLWRRILLIPFAVTIEECDQDPHLTRKLEAEASGILNWLIVGCLAWQKDGLEAPLSVQLATSEYREESDIVGQFIDDCLVVGGEDDWVELVDVHDRYQMWASSNDFRKMSRQILANKLREHGVTLTKDAPKSHRTRVRFFSLVAVGTLFGGRELC